MIRYGAIRYTVIDIRDGSLRRQTHLHSYSYNISLSYIKDVLSGTRKSKKRKLSHQFSYLAHFDVVEVEVMKHYQQD